MNRCIKKIATVSTILAVTVLAGCGKDVKEYSEDDSKDAYEEYEEAYSGVLDVYYYGLKNPKVYDKFDINIDYNSCAVSVYAKSEDDKGGPLDYAGYGFIDLNGDGIKELIIGSLAKDENKKLDKMIYSICMLRNNVPEDLLWCRQVGPEDKMTITVDDYDYLCKENRIANVLYEKNAQGDTWEVALLELPLNGEHLECVEKTIINKDAYGKMTYKKQDKDGKITDLSEKKARKMVDKDQYKSIRMQADLKPFSQYTPRTAEGYYEENAGWIFGKGFSSWKEGYKAFLERDTSDSYEYNRYGFIYVDDDDIPELAIDGDCEAAGCQILSYHDGEVTELNTSRLYFTYIEKKGLLCNSEGNMGLYYDNVYSLSKRGWTTVFLGEYYDFGPEGAEYDEELGRYHTLHYEIDEKEVAGEKEYLNKLSEVYNAKEEKEPEYNLSYAELMEQLNIE